jgi:methylenetetrahydrofolate reductase (NADPH)
MSDAGVDRCPKNMLFGPCGGVLPSGECEVATFGPCVFLDRPLTPWPYGVGATILANGVEPSLRPAPLIVVDIVTNVPNADAITRDARRLAGAVDAVLHGDLRSGRLQFPPSFTARILLDAGVKPWPGINCRDRNRVALESELLALRALDVRRVHCVTGDHPASGDRPDAMSVFDLESFTLAALAVDLGFTVSVAETPGAPPYEIRPQRLAEKARTGATICFVNHAGEVEDVAAFVGAASAACDTSMAFIVCVAAAFDRETAASLDAYPSHRVPQGYFSSVSQGAHPWDAGVEVATAYGRQVLAIPGVVGVDLGAFTPAGATERDRSATADGLAAIAKELRQP